MLASILVPIRNGERYLEPALDSVLGAANGAPYEVIVQDSASTDRTPAIVEAHSAAIRYFREPDEGQSDGLNRALARARGDFVGWFNADDLYLPNSIALAAGIFARDDNVDVVYGHWMVIDGNDKVLRRHSVAEWDWHRLFVKGNYIFTGATFFRRRIFERFGGFSTKYHYVADLEFFLRVGADVTTVHAGSALGAFRYHAESKTGSQRFQFCTEAAQVRRTHLHSPQAGIVAYGRAQGELWISALAAPLRYSAPYSRLRLWQRRAPR